MSEPSNRDVEALRRWFHDSGDGGVWETFDRANSETVARALLVSDWLAERDAQQRAEALRRAAEAIETGPMVVNDLARDASRAAFLAKWLRDRAERQRPTGLESTRPTHPGG